MTTERQFIAAAEAEEPLFVGVDVGGTSIKIGVVDNLGRTINWLAIPTEGHTGPEEAAQRIATAMRQLIGESELSIKDIEFVGLGSPGTMDLSVGMILAAHNLPGWTEAPIRDLLSKACGKPVALANDANAAAYGEFWVGSGQAFRSMVLFTLGTGIGGGIIIGDTLIEGENSAGAELGHMIIDYHDTARLCGCGHRGHLEAYCSAVAVVKRTEEVLAEGRTSTLRTRIEEGQSLTPKLIADEAEEEDELALEIIDDTARYLAVGIVTVLHTVDPAAVVLGGAMNFGGNETMVGRRFLARVQQEVALRALEPLATRTTIDFASLGGDAGYIGAAGIARLEYMKFIK
jgi:glucokinase